MINIIRNIILPLAILILISESCVKDDIEQIDNDSTFKPSYSLPIGEKEITLKNFITTNLDPDTAGISSEYIFYYDNNYFKSPISLHWHDYISFDFNKLTNNFESIESLMLRLNIVNEIPAKSNLMLSFSYTDSTGSGADIFLSNFTIESAQTSIDGSTIQPEQYQKNFNIDKNEISEFIKRKSININLRLTIINPSDKIIQYLSTQSLKIQLAIRFSFEPTTDKI